MLTWMAGAGAVGAVARWLTECLVVAHLRQPRAWATLAVNILGAALLGLVIGLAQRGAIDDEMARIIGAGFLGSFTTFATWMLDATDQIQNRKLVNAALNVIGSLTLGVAAAYGSWWLAGYLAGQ